MKNNTISSTSTEFETNNSNISLTIFDEDNKKIYHWKKDSTNKADNSIKNNRYAALKPPKTKFMRLDKMLKSFSHKELKEYILNRIHTNPLNDISNTNDWNDLNDINNTNDSNK